MKFRYAGLSLVLVAMPALAHDFWLQPFRYQLAPGAPFVATFQVGHGPARQRWGNDVSRVLIFADVYNGKRRDIRKALRNGGAADAIAILPETGFHVLAMQTGPSFSNLPAVRFNDYAREEGLSLVLAHRERTGNSKSPGLETYSRRAKSIVQVGQQNAMNSASVTRPIGLKLEIVPTRNPYALGVSRMLPIRVFYRGRPLANATVKLTRLEADEKPLAVAITDRLGGASFRIPQNGSWLLNTLWSEPIKGDKRAQFETTFSSLTFGFGMTQP